MYDANMKVVMSDGRLYIALIYEAEGITYAIVELNSSRERSIGKGNNVEEAVEHGIYNVNNGIRE